MKPSLLVLAPRLPYPVVGGDRLRIYQVCRSLSRDYALTLLSLCESAEELNRALPDDGIFTSVERFLLPQWRSWVNTLRALPSQQPLQVAYYQSPQFTARARELSLTHDGVLAHLIRTGAVVADLRVPKFLEMTDAISLNYERVRANKDRRLRDPRVLIYSVESRRLLAQERSMVDHFDAAFLVSQVDRDYLFGADPVRAKKVHVCPNGVDLQGLPYQFDPAGTDLVYIGNMCSLQNFDAAYFAAADILPKIRAQRPRTRLRLIGRIPPEKAAELRRFAGVDVTGEVPSIAEAAAGAAVAVAPLRIGAGVQNKILEYLALGLPTVSTTIALEGFGTRSGRDLLVADTADAQAQAALGLLADRAEAQRLASNGRGYVESHHDWEVVMAPMKQVIAQRLAVRR